MLKRPSSPATLPPTKRLSSRHLVLLPDDETLEGLKTWFKNFVLPDVAGKDVTEEKFEFYNAIYWKVREIHKGERFLTEEEFRANLELERHNFFAVLKRAFTEFASLADMGDIVSHSVFWTPGSSHSTFGTEPPSELVRREPQERATEDSWMGTFVGQSPLEGLKLHVADQLTLPDVYGRYCSIVQSSGMGKSRMLDELSKDYFLIPINLRGATSRGFPPADFAVRDFLKANGSHLPRGEANIRMRCLLLALFEKTKETLRNDRMGSSKTERISNFWNLMSKDQSMNSPGSSRTLFYGDVVRLAGEMIESKGTTPSDKQLIDALQALSAALNANSDKTQHCICTSDGASVDIFIAFDEAHTLADSYDEDKESRFISLRRVLHSLGSQPLFSFFLSTTGKVTQFGQPRGEDTSARINGGEFTSPRPYVFVGFDQLAGDFKFQQGQTLDYVTSLRFISHLGRPLWGSRYKYGDDDVRSNLLNFAVQKLLGMDVTPASLNKAQRYAVLSQRLALDINTIQYLTSDGPLQLMQVLHDQVANHMRVVVAVGTGIETLYAVASSEPILSEAASHAMRLTNFSMPKALSEVLSGFCISRGDRGELVVAALFTCARDALVKSKPRLLPEQLCHQFSVKALFENLFSKTTCESIMAYKPSLWHSGSEADQLQFGQAFDGAYMHFNHFIKPQEQKLISRGYLLLYLARGAAALGANCQPGFDAVYPFLHGGRDLVRRRVGFIIVQVKNDLNFRRATSGVFPNMDPLKCGLIARSDLEDGCFPIPIIRILFSLHGDDPSVKRMEYEMFSEGAVDSLGEHGRPLFTTYDIMCQGFSPKIFQPAEKSPDVWTSLIRQCQWASLYQVSVPDVVRAQLPGCGSHVGHWTPWVEGLTDII